MKSVERNVFPLSEYYIYSPSKTAQDIFLYPLQCGFFVYEPGYLLRRSSFNSFLLMYIQKGRMTVDLAGKRQTVAEKQFTLIDCYQPHGYTTQEGCENLWLHFDGAQARHYYAYIVAGWEMSSPWRTPSPSCER